MDQNSTSTLPGIRSVLKALMVWKYDQSITKDSKNITEVVFVSAIDETSHSD